MRFTHLVAAFLVTTIGCVVTLPPIAVAQDCNEILAVEITHTAQLTAGQYSEATDVDDDGNIAGGGVKILNRCEYGGTHQVFLRDPSTLEVLYEGGEPVVVETNACDATYEYEGTDYLLPGNCDNPPVGCDFANNDETHAFYKPIAGEIMSLGWNPCDISRTLVGEAAAQEEFACPSFNTANAFRPVGSLDYFAGSKGQMRCTLTTPCDGLEYCSDYLENPNQSRKLTEINRPWLTVRRDEDWIEGNPYIDPFNPTLLQFDLADLANPVPGEDSLPAAGIAWDMKTNPVLIVGDVATEAATCYEGGIPLSRPFVHQYPSATFIIDSIVIDGDVYEYGTARAINDHHEVLINWQTVDFDGPIKSSLCIYDIDAGECTENKIIPDNGAMDSFALDMNENGTIVGYLQDGGGSPYKAVVWRYNRESGEFGPIDFIGDDGTLDQQGAIAFAVNNNNQVVGIAGSELDTSTEEAQVFYAQEEEGDYQCGDLLNQYLIPTEGINLLAHAFDIADSGIFSGSGLLNVEGVLKAYAAQLLQGLGYTEVSCSDSTFTDRVTCGWSEVSGATSYAIYRRDLEQPDYKLLDTATSLVFDDFDTLPGLPYYYQVLACNEASCNGLTESADISESHIDDGLRSTGGPTRCESTNDTALQPDNSFCTVVGIDSETIKGSSAQAKQVLKEVK